MSLINWGPLPLMTFVLLLPYAHSTASQSTSQRLNTLLAPFEIEADVQEGEALLHGEVDSEIERDLAEELAAGIDGIEVVKNQLEVRPADSSVGSQVQCDGGRRFPLDIFIDKLKAGPLFTLWW